MRLPSSRCLLVFSFLLLVSDLTLAESSDREALLALKSTVDPSNSLPWEGYDFCNWQGIRECLRGRVTKMVVEYLNLTGTLDAASLNRLDQLRVLSFKGNSISGEIPDLSGLTNLKSLFLNDNQFSGYFPSSISDLHRLKVVVLSGNKISGNIPSSLLKLRRLYVLYLQDNRLTGELPPLNQTSLRFFNVSNNKLSGEIPITPALIRFNFSSFSGNLDLCGDQIDRPCSNGTQTQSLPPISPASPINTPSGSSSHRRRRKLVAIIVGSIGGFLLLLICLSLAWRACRRRNAIEGRSKAMEGAAEGGAGEGSGGTGGNNGGKRGGFSWEGEGLGSLVFCGAGDQQMTYSLEDLLKASAETLGRGTMGSTYKAVMESGFIVTVKRLKDSRYPRLDEFRRQMEVLGRLRHPNLVPLRAYFQAKEERLLVYDYFPNGSLFSLIHGNYHYLSPLIS
uniref:Protein kinase domain-containing protein n=1 Tax=Nelumbo nucifera TaxID=4432 RepID=A0A822YWV5_NELNU|nr:TPA_asm: hypothetical protein HUJ06_006651 [Nelumbo nucifera]